ncbi:MAG: phosphate/phosphite/phosphonate ABC transporter substrate-binding protein [Candidatus Sericytochromatia bacterium]|nr:phosphate/phosphite/phosphonate ABC transporter substrate-binding protein [Candidatus Tanganyikabacteria bacterium]
MRALPSRLMLAAALLLGLATLAPPPPLALAAPAPAREVLRIGFVPSDKFDEMFRKVAPLVADLSRRLGVRVVPFVATDYTGVVEAMANRKLDAAFLAPLAYVFAEQKARVRLMLKAVRNGRQVFYSAIIVRKESPIRKLDDLRGRTFAFGDPLSVAGTIFPSALLRTNGIDPDSDLRRLPGGGHDATVLAVLHGKAEAGAVFCNDPQGKEGAWTVFLKKPEERQAFRTIAVSKAIPNDVFCVRPDLTPGLAKRLKSAFLDMGRTPEGRRRFKEIYNIDAFVEARPSDYDSVREALAGMNRRP